MTAPDPEGWTLVAGFQPVMGTHLELQITATSEAEARAAERTALAEATRLEAMFTVFDPASELCRWRTGALAEPGPELVRVLALADSWHARSRNTFNPVAGVMTERWLEAVAEGVAPSTVELDALAASIAEPRFAVNEGTVVRLGDCASVDLNAIAKGHVVDLIAQRVLDDHDVVRLVVNAGGDLVHRGDGALRVSVQDPRRASDNAAPLTRIEISNAAVATSGRARRWFDIDGERHSRVLDPRTGRPVSACASATVIASDAATADVLATIASVLEPGDAADLAFVTGTDGAPVSTFVVGQDGIEHRNQEWMALETNCATA